MSSAEDDDELADTYIAQFAAAWDAGWREPEMNDYDDYDVKKVLQK